LAGGEGLDEAGERGHGEAEGEDRFGDVFAEVSADDAIDDCEVEGD
jgi:hypothetical protein